METIKKFHWFWAWDDEKEETWLSEMSKKGWHFKSVGLLSNYIFEQGKPIDYTYRLDYFIDHKDKSIYLQLFQDAGWSHLGEMGGWQYFRKEGLNGEEQEIYSDRESKAKKYRRIMLYLVIFFPIYMNFILVLSRSNDGVMQVVTFFMFIILLVYIYAMVKLLSRITRLMKKI